MSSRSRSIADYEPGQRHSSFRRPASTQTSLHRSTTKRSSSREPSGISAARTALTKFTQDDLTVDDLLHIVKPFLPDKAVEAAAPYGPDIDRCYRVIRHSREGKKFRELLLESFNPAALKFTPPTPDKWLEWWKAIKELYKEYKRRKRADEHAAEAKTRADGHAAEAKTQRTRERRIRSANDRERGFQRRC